MKRRTFASMAALASLMAADVALFNVAQAFDMGNMMNPSRWFDDDDYYDRYRYGGYGPYGYGGYGPYGGWGGPWGGYGPYGYGGYGPYGYGGYPSTIVVNPSNQSERAPAAPPPRLPE